LASTDHVIMATATKHADVRRMVGRLARFFALAIVIVVLLPYFIAPLYRFVDPVSTLMLWRWLTGARVERVVLPVERIAPALPVTVLAAEDARFCSHRGVDFSELREAFAEADLAEMRGGSTITQQLAKNLFLWQGRSFIRKALEFPLAFWLDLALGKRRQIEIYLNIAEWGPNGEFGAEAGARFAFGKSAQSLSVREAALLAAILPNPRRRSARMPGTTVRRLAGIYEARAARAGVSASCLRRRR